MGCRAGRAERQLADESSANWNRSCNAGKPYFRQRGVDSSPDTVSCDGAGCVSHTDPFGDVFLVVDGLGKLRRDSRLLRGVRHCCSRFRSSARVLSASRWRSSDHR